MNYVISYSDIMINFIKYQTLYSFMCRFQYLQDIINITIFNTQQISQ